MQFDNKKKKDKEKKKYSKKELQELGIYIKKNEDYIDDKEKD